MSKVIREDTLVPLGIAVVAIGTITAWAVEVKSQVRSHAEVIESLRQANEANIKLISEINSRLSRIEWKLEVRNNKEK